jgi:hypothetical protein
MPQVARRDALGRDITLPERWLTQQMLYDLWQAEYRRKGLQVKRLGDSGEPVGHRVGRKEKKGLQEKTP